MCFELSNLKGLVEGKNSEIQRLTERNKALNAKVQMLMKQEGEVVQLKQRVQYLEETRQVQQNLFSLFFFRYSTVNPCLYYS